VLEEHEEYAVFFVNFVPSWLFSEGGLAAP